MSLVTGRDAVALWGYPLWLFLGLWIVLNARPLERVTLWRIVCLWAVMFVATAAGLRLRLRPVATFRRTTSR